MTKAVVAVGSNLGDRQQNLYFAFDEISKLPSTKILSKSSLYETQAIGGPEQGAFLNAAVLVETELHPNELLIKLQSIETARGRTREINWGPRTLDLDIIDVENFTSDTEELQIPHPRAVSRRFVIEPIIEIAPNWKFSERSVSEILNELSDQKVSKWEG